MFQSVGALVYVIDSQDEYLSALQNLAMIIKYAVSVNPKIHIEVMIHKIDGLSEDYRLDIQRDIMQRVGDDLIDYGLEGVQISFFLTSIFDHSIYEAFSRIVQKLIYELPALENLLDLVMQYSNFDKVFLFDINSKIYVATDSSPVDIQTYEVCAEFIDVCIDMNGIYSSSNKDLQNGQEVVPVGPLENHKGLKCVSKLGNGSMLYLREMIRGLALVAVTSGNTDDETKTLAVIDHNVAIFKKSLEKMWSSSRIN